MKKVLCLVLAVVMLLSCATACSGKKKIEIVDLNSLDGLTVAFQAGTTSDDLLTDLVETKTIAATMVQNEKVLTCFTQLENGEVDAILTDSTVAESYVEANADKYQIAWVQESDAENFGIAIPLGQKDIQAAINEAMAILDEEGIIDAMVSKWFGDGSSELVMPKEQKVTGYDLSLLNEGTLTVGASIDYPPYESYASDGVTPIGFDVDLVTAVATLLGLEVSFIDTAFEGIFGGMGVNFDVVCSGVTINDERLENMLFSDPYIENYQCIVIAK